MPRGIVSPGGVPEILSAAKILGDTSTIRKFYGARGEEMAVQRMMNRLLGRLGGKTTGMVKAHFGLFGMIALAEFLTFFKGWINFKSAQPVWVGSIANYASYIDNGWVNPNTGKVYEPSSFFTQAVFDTVQGRGENKAFKNLFKIPSFVNKSGGLRTRAGLYEGQKFVSDFHGFFTGDIVGRSVRREAGRGIASFFWGTLRDPHKNILEGMAQEVVRRSRHNLLHASVDWVEDGVIEDTGVLRASMAYGVGEDQFIQNSWKQARTQMARAGTTHLETKKLDISKSGASAPMVGPELGIG